MKLGANLSRAQIRRQQREHLELPLGARHVPSRLRHGVLEPDPELGQLGRQDARLFGNDDEQDARLDELERRMRQVTERISQLSADLSQARMELLKTRISVDKAVKHGDLDPVFGQLNESLRNARAKLDESQSAADESWAMLQEGSDAAVAALREGIVAWARLNEAEGA